MQNKNIPTEGQNSNKQDTESALRDAACSFSSFIGVSRAVIGKRFSKGFRRLLFLMLSFCFIPLGFAEQVYYRLKLFNDPRKDRLNWYQWLFCVWCRSVIHSTGVFHHWDCYRWTHREGEMAFMGFIFKTNGKHMHHWKRVGKMLLGLRFKLG